MPSAKIPVIFEPFADFLLRKLFPELNGFLTQAFLNRLVEDLSFHLVQIPTFKIHKKK